MCKLEKRNVFLIDYETFHIKNYEIGQCRISTKINAFPLHKKQKIFLY